MPDEGTFQDALPSYACFYHAIFYSLRKRHHLKPRQNLWRDRLTRSGLQIGETAASSMVDLDLPATRLASRDKADVDRDF